MKKTLLPLLVCAALSAGTTHAATPPSTLIVAQTLDDLVSLDPAESNKLSSIQTLQGSHAEGAVDSLRRAKLSGV